MKTERLQQIRDEIAVSGLNLENAYADRAWLLHQYDALMADYDALSGRNQTLANTVADLTKRLSEETSRADRAEEKMRAGWIEVCQSGLARFKRERDEAVTYAERMETALRVIREWNGDAPGVLRLIDQALAKNSSQEKA